MSQPSDEEEDEIFSGKALGEDGALKPASGVPVLNEVPPASSPASPAPPVPGASLLDDPAYEPTVISIPPRVRDVADRPTPVELAETRPPPMSSDYVAPRAEKAPRFGSPDIPWGKWLLRVALLGVVVAGGWVVVTGKIPLGQVLAGPSALGIKKEEVTEKREGTPAPTLLILSDPSGATVLVAGTEVGVTPWAGDNVWPSKEPLRVEVRKAGLQALGGAHPGWEAGDARGEPQEAVKGSPPCRGDSGSWVTAAPGRTRNRGEKPLPGGEGASASGLGDRFCTWYEPPRVEPVGEDDEATGQRAFGKPSVGEGVKPPDWVTGSSPGTSHHVQNRSARTTRLPGSARSPRDSERPEPRRPVRIDRCPRAPTLGVASGRAAERPTASQLLGENRTLSSRNPCCNLSDPASSSPAGQRLA